MIKNNLEIDVRSKVPGGRRHASAAWLEMVGTFQLRNMSADS